MKTIKVESKVKQQPPITMTKQQAPSMQSQAQAIRRAVKVIKTEKDEDNEQE